MDQRIEFALKALNAGNFRECREYQISAKTGYKWKERFIAKGLEGIAEGSRMLLELRWLPDSRTETVRERFERLFERHGLPGAIRSDNGAPFASHQGLLGLTRLSAWWLALGISLERSRAGQRSARTHAPGRETRAPGRADRPGSGRV